MSCPCRLVGGGVHALFGPTDPLLGTHVHSVCDALDIPHLEVRLDLDTNYREFSINLHPSQDMLNRAFLDLMGFLNWTKVAVIYEEDYGLMKLRDLVREDMELYVRQADPASYRTVLKDIKAKEIYNLIVDTRADTMRYFLREVLQLQMNDYKYHFVFTTFDMESFDLEDFKYNFVNITSFRIVDAEDMSVREVLKDMERNLNKSKGIQSEPALMFDAVHVFAIGLQSLEQGHALRPSNVSCNREEPWDGGLSLTNYISAVSSKPSGSGEIALVPPSLLHQRRCPMLVIAGPCVEHKGLSGPVAFKEGRRVQFKLDLLKLKQHALVKVGEWTPRQGVNITDHDAFFDAGSMNVTLVVVTILEFPYVMMHYEKNYTGNARFYGFCVDLLARVSREVGFDYIIDLVPDRKYGAQDPATGEWNGMVLQLMKHETPYVMLRDGWANLTGNDRFEGFCIELLQTIAATVGFEYTLQLVPDGKYGVFDLDTGEWNGIVRQLMDKVTLHGHGDLPELADQKADLAVGSMTINYARESVIDFTKPFMNLGISILFKVPTSQPTRLFSFMNPLSVHVWMLVVLAYILVSLTMYITARFSPYEWRGPLESVANHFSIVNCFWFAIGTLMQQGSDLNPRAASTRIVGGIWWFFTLIIIASYTANLAAFLTVERMITPIENAEDLAGQTDIAYGTLEGGSTMTFFRDSMIETYKKMWRFMENKKPSVFVSTYEEGIQRVLQGNYAFLMESTMLDYIVQRDCNLTSIGDLLDSKGYGIATPIGSPWRDKISLVILELQEKGEIQMLYDKWWKNTGSTCERTEKGKENKANSLGVANIGGVFVVLLCGLAVAMTMAIFEFCYFTRRVSARFEMAFPQPSLCSQIADELCLAVTCDSRPVAHVVAATLPPPAPPPPPPRPAAAVRSRSLGALPQALPPPLAPAAALHRQHQHREDDLALCPLPPVPPPPHLVSVRPAPPRPAPPASSGKQL
ncbi:Glutamate receptor ionotropic, kainate 1 [Frankliniella fusca]|uniref:Glutamate receptor ionotropic, kainate 1 n=1 Tax=Frankliniella fusca TaxID=407009 RepID=A0AAE1HNC2_9NEOP|nr:Glutamate receptor ionotropic, kainate 1 [Frankliniella fusca]